MVTFLGFLTIAIFIWMAHGLLTPETTWGRRYHRDSRSRIVSIGVAAFLVAVLLAVSFTEGASETKPEQDDQQQVASMGSTSDEARATEEESEENGGAVEEAEASSPSPAAEYMQRIQRELEGLSDFDGSQYRDSKDGIFMGVVLFSAWGKTIREAQNYDLAKEQLDSVQTFRDRVSEIQRQEYPRLRDAYGPILRQVLWEHDVTAKTFGSGFRVVQFVGGIFAANRNKKQFQEEMQEALRQLRFRQARYKWYEGATEYTYWDMDTPDDGMVGEWTNSSWVEAQVGEK